MTAAPRSYTPVPVRGEATARRDVSGPQGGARWPAIPRKARVMHHCPIRICARDDIPDHRFMCLTHWRLVPEPIQKAVNIAYAHGAGVGTGELVAAHRAAIRAVNAALNYPFPEE